MGRRSLVRGRDPFGFALSKIPLLAQRTREKWGTHGFHFVWRAAVTIWKELGKVGILRLRLVFALLRKDQSSLRMTHQSQQTTSIVIALSSFAS